MKFNSREISWLSFNDRVLQEAADKTVPLMERIKFLGIFSSNLDEFFRVRVATLRRMLPLGKKAKKIIGDSPKTILNKVYEMVLVQQEKFENIYDQLLLELGEHQIFILNENELSEEQGKFVSNYFKNDVRAALVPIMIDHVKEFPYLKDRRIYLAIELLDSSKKEKPLHAIIEIPKELNRFVVLPETVKRKSVMILDDVIRYCLKDIFYVYPHDTFKAYTIKNDSRC